MLDTLDPILRQVTLLDTLYQHEDQQISNFLQEYVYLRLLQCYRLFSIAALMTAVTNHRKCIELMYYHTIVSAG